MRAFWLVAAVAALSIPNANDAAAQEKKLLAVCSTTQVADFTRQVIGDRWDVQCVLAPGQDPHLYQIKPDDVKLVAQADLCLENGWHLEGKDWMKSLARDAGKELVTCIEGVEPLELEEGGTPYKDPHAWFSPANAAVYVRNILAAVTKVDPAHAAEYRARASLYLSQLQALNAWVQLQVNAVPANRRILVTSHDAFNYFCRQYGFKSASPAGWSTGEEIGGGITPARRRETVESIRQYGVKAIFVETSVNPKIVREIAREAGVEVGGELYSDSMGAPDTAGETYIGMMRENVLKIVQALK
ncbi:MAG: metal ABC transporter substrate-binding protein [Planctomycetes bacterium]|nr:metal ABC transporter substrate-binding protein [Planctomycetota bacterium]